MVKGITRQVIVINGTAKASFDQAIFLIRNDLIANGGITEEQLLQEAQRACVPADRSHIVHKLIWSFSGAAAIGLFWLATALLI